MFRYFGPACGPSARSGWRRPMKPRIFPSGDREHGTIAESVDEPARTGHRSHPRLQSLLVGEAATAQMVDQVRPPGWRVAGAEAVIASYVCPEAFV